MQQTHATPTQIDLLRIVLELPAGAPTTERVVATESYTNRSADPPPPDVIDGIKYYEVSKIVWSKIDNRCRCPLRYLVRWTGYEEPTWSAATDLTGCAELVEEFHEEHPDNVGSFESYLKFVRTSVRACTSVRARTSVRAA